MRAAGVGRLVFSSTAATYGEPDVDADRRGHADRAGQHVRQHEARGRPDADRRGARARSRGRLAAVLQRRGRERAARRGPPPGDAPDPAGAAGRGRQARLGRDLRHRLPDRRTARRSATTSTSRISARAHLLALEKAVPGRHDIYNLGIERGYSVREVIETARAVTGREIVVREEGRRAGDPPRLVAANARARAGLGLDARADRSRTWCATPGRGTRRTPTATELRAAPAASRRAWSRTTRRCP